MHDVETGSLLTEGTCGVVEAMQADQNKIVFGTSKGSIIVMDVRVKNPNKPTPSKVLWQEGPSGVRTLQYAGNYLITGIYLYLAIF